MSRENRKAPLRGAALIALSVGAAGSLGLMLYAGRHNNSRILLALMTIWVLSPFAALLLAAVVWRRWTKLAESKLNGVTLVLALGSLAVYGAAALMHVTKAATVYVVVPPVSCLLLAITLSIAVFRNQ